MQRYFGILKPLAGVVLGFLLLGLSACEEVGGINAVVSSPSAGGGSSIEQDIERPDIFSVTENALWDGRPSLGGVWVAYPGEIDPERVLITNTATGDSVIGALFRRERENPGPSIQLSSDAASSIGVLAGSPTEISIVVLRRETIVVEPAPAEPVVEISEPVAIGDIVEEVLSETTFPVAVVENVPPPPARAPVTEEHVDIAEQPAPEPAPAPTVRLPSKPFIQIGTFSTEQRALDLVTILANEGVLAEVRTNTSGERTLYRVISGPASTRAERDDRLAIIKSLGFNDAFIFG